MPSLNIIIGSTLGGAEYVGDHLEEIASNQSISCQQYNPVTLEDLASGYWLICTSTHGAGDMPDNLLAFYEALLTSEKDLTGIKFGVIGLGDSSYDTFCDAAKKLETLFIQRGAIKIGERLEIDAQNPTMPEDLAEAWFVEWIQSLS